MDDKGKFSMDDKGKYCSHGSRIARALTHECHDCAREEIDRLRAELETAQADKAEAIVMARANTEARIAAWLLRDPDGVNSDAALMIARGYYLNRKGADDGK